MSMENSFQNIPPQETESSIEHPAKEQNVDRELLKLAIASALTARETSEGIVFKDEATGTYRLLDQGHGWQNYSHEVTEEDWQAGKETREASIAAYTDMLRNWGHIE